MESERIERAENSHRTSPKCSDYLDDLDAVSLYPSAMNLFDYPIGKPYWEQDTEMVREALNSCDESLPLGIVECEISPDPNTIFPLLSHKTRDGRFCFFPLSFGSFFYFPYPVFQLLSPFMSLPSSCSPSSLHFRFRPVDCGENEKGWGIACRRFSLFGLDPVFLILAFSWSSSLSSFFLILFLSMCLSFLSSPSLYCMHLLCSSSSSILCLSLLLFCLLSLDVRKKRRHQAERLRRESGKKEKLKRQREEKRKEDAEERNARGNEKNRNNKSAHFHIALATSKERNYREKCWKERVGRTDCRIRTWRKAKS